MDNYPYAFGWKLGMDRIDYGQVIKHYTDEEEGSARERRYSPGRVVSIEKEDHLRLAGTSPDVHFPCRAAESHEADVYQTANPPHNCVELMRATANY
jgi:hypothetical protein